MEPLIIRDRRYRLQTQLQALDAESQQSEARALEEEIEELQRICPHEHREDSTEEGIWRCRDCDLSGQLEGVAAAQEADADGGEEAQQS